MIFTPKPDQEMAVNELRKAVKEGYKRIILQAACGFGKTHVSAMIIDSALAKGKKVIFAAPYTTLIDQTVEKFMEQEIPQPGVMQGDHELTDPGNPLQIATVQTLARRKVPEFDIAIIDEVHLAYKIIFDLMEQRPDALFIGLSATPWTKGLGKHYDKLIKIRSLRENLQNGTLCPYDVYGVEAPDLGGVGTVGDDYNQKQAGAAMNKPKLVGNIVQNWLERGESKQTIVFAQNVLHANEIANKFAGVSVRAEVFTANTPKEERKRILKGYSDREVRVIVSVGCLTAGFDSFVEVLIWACATKSAMKFVQSIGRLLRQDGKDRGMIFDHAGTFGGGRNPLGFVEDVDAMFDELCDGDNEKAKVKKLEREKKIKEPKKCPAPECGHLKPVGVYECPKCGFKPRYGEDEDVDESRGLKSLTKQREASRAEKQQYYSELLGYQKLSKKPVKDGEVANHYKDKFGIWPNGLRRVAASPTEATMNIIKAKKRAYAIRAGYAQRAANANR